MKFENTRGKWTTRMPRPKRSGDTKYYWFQGRVKHLFKGITEVIAVTNHYGQPRVERAGSPIFDYPENFNGKWNGPVIKPRIKKAKKRGIRLSKTQSPSS